MKKIEIYIREVDVDDDFNELGHKFCRVATVVDEEILDQNLAYLLNTRWEDFIDFYLRNRHDIPFTKIRRDHEPLEN